MISFTHFHSLDPTRPTNSCKILLVKLWTWITLIQHTAATTSPYVYHTAIVYKIISKKQCLSVIPLKAARRAARKEISRPFHHPPSPLSRLFVSLSSPVCVDRVKLFGIVCARIRPQSFLFATTKINSGRELFVNNYYVQIVSRLISRTCTRVSAEKFSSRPCSRPFSFTWERCEREEHDSAIGGVGGAGWCGARISNIDV